MEVGQLAKPNLSSYSLGAKMIFLYVLNSLDEEHSHVQHGTAMPPNLHDQLKGERANSAQVPSQGGQSPHSSAPAPPHLAHHSLACHHSTGERQ